MTTPYTWFNGGPVEPDPEPATDPKESVPACKGCGSRNLVAQSVATIVVNYIKPTHVEDGALHFADSWSGDGERERWEVRCGDCGRRMRTNLWPIGH